ncbi:hypothetical protein CC1G_10906 [Coprinopsis cinerea okayama7|uniref:Uncharacterized protein n=1 Tax=Coprinopsis cinerea (strain Okayama-7 / 130 / ATCC MYA-4618 / FGSC 9003) TaxID=240176 RepID=A8P5X7_COPC7|nr:hypothetical protein CC1G_10906 [Coprinopsis cinerea okayama7\|eukprot:XP_001839043.1 hypothetical protein CC1G_10906 [Coprinopsis cinerea okayama7\
MSKRARRDYGFRSPKTPIKVERLSSPPDQLHQRHRESPHNRPEGGADAFERDFETQDSFAQSLSPGFWTNRCAASPVSQNSLAESTTVGVQSPRQKSVSQSVGVNVETQSQYPWWHPTYQTSPSTASGPALSASSPRPRDTDIRTWCPFCVPSRQRIIASLTEDPTASCCRDHYSQMSFQVQMSLLQLDTRIKAADAHKAALLAERDTYYALLGHPRD